MDRPRIAPSILSADFACLGDAVAQVAPEADTLHVDVMDGHFVPNLTIGPPVVQALRRRTDLYLDCHLMMTNPGDYLEAFKRAGADGCSVHVEIGQHGRSDRADAVGRRSTSGSPSTPRLRSRRPMPWLDRIDLLLLMTVHPGFGGQSFIADVMPKVRDARRLIDERGLSVAIQVDGGIDERTAPVAAAAGAEVFVAGNAIFGADDPRQAVERLRAAAATAAA